MAENLVGQVIDQFQIHSVLGEGGMGIVYRATDLNLRRNVAIKFVHRHLARRPEFVERFRREAQTVARFNHPSIVQIFSSGYAQQVQMPYMVMEYIPKGSLTRFIKRMEARNQQLEIREVLLLVAQIADALAYAHRHKTVHRDIKPDNILLRSVDTTEQKGLPVRAVVTDFGLVKLRDANSGLTATGNIMGTLAYMSPEQCRGDDLDGRSDIYSLGIMLFQLVTGSLPFKSTSQAKAIHDHIYTAPPPPTAIRPDLPPSVAYILDKVLAKDPADRYQLSSEFAYALRQSAETLDNPLLAAPEQTTLAPTASLITEIMAEPPPPDQTVLGDSGSFLVEGMAAATRPAFGQPAINLEVGLAQRAVEIAPGGSGLLRLNIVNRAPQSVLCSVAVEGISAEWVSMVDSVLVSGGGHEQIAITIQPPRTRDTTAGIRPITIRVHTGATTNSGNVNPQQSYAVPGSLHISPFEQFNVAMAADPVENGETRQIRVRNEGNAPASFSLTPNLVGDDIEHIVEPQQLTLAPNESGEFALTLRASQRPLVGGQQSKPFTATVQQEFGTTQQRVGGELIVIPRMPLWLAGVLGLLAIILLGAIIFLNRPTDGPVVVDTTPTVDEVAVVTEPAAPPVDNNVAAPAATAAAATAQAELTAVASEDSDGDGLPDVQEEAGCTDPLSADTDGDDLSDGEELNADPATDPCSADSDNDGVNDRDENLNGTNPTLADTDGDTLTDGAELASNGCSDPLNPDTDGDGIRDDADPKPCDSSPSVTPTGPPSLASVLPQANWLPSRTRLLFVSDRNGDDAVFMTDLTNPAAAQQLTVAPSGGSDWWPSWCGDDQVIFERGDTFGNQEIYAQSLSDREVTQMTHTVRPINSQRNGIASCSPDGNYLAFSSLAIDATRGNHYEVGVIPLAEESPAFIPLGGGQRYGGNITWSPDSSAVVFMQFDTPVQLYRVNMSNLDSAITLTNDDGVSHKYPAWSPVDNRIAFACSAADDLWYLCLVSANGGATTNTGVVLGTGKERVSRPNGRPAHFGRPSWSPDGRFIAYAGSPEGDNWDIYLYELSTGDLYNITNTPSSDEMHPRWER